MMINSWSFKQRILLDTNRQSFLSIPEFGNAGEIGGFFVSESYPETALQRYEHYKGEKE
ncbi:hypothetical protein [Cytobacillus firmus]|uniref:hypothetical protein n=1 Tax=Cytobacillus firmus TaxID=1399 RepID=UPI002FFF933E